ncbi:Sporulation protein YhaL [Oceanobacillus limi]|uniref:Sporulation protein YhaL n=1 Tax=Oceanobacillus limi TaxID=930131 RepID=A0A1H9YM20_9BACI|nr:sporulation YhaL family protein [Oceanobacillus limi]SES69540.1 Sporulation protein YhaL [Oceanobacillus limi]
MIFGVPWWVFMMVLFIFLSGYMAFRAMRAEKELEKQYIEREGKVYMDRIEEDRLRRLQQDHEQTQQASN